MLIDASEMGLLCEEFFGSRLIEYCLAIERRGSVLLYWHVDHAPQFLGQLCLDLGRGFVRNGLLEGRALDAFFGQVVGSEFTAQVSASIVATDAGVTPRALAALHDAAEPPHSVLAFGIAAASRPKFWAGERADIAGLANCLIRGLLSQPGAQRLQLLEALRTAQRCRREFYSPAGLPTV